MFHKPGREATSSAACQTDYRGVEQARVRLVLTIAANKLARLPRLLGPEK
jgi:hypothetical protein